MDLKEVVIFTIGLFGLEDLHFNLMKQLLAHSTVNLVLKLYLYGILLNNLLNRKIDPMIHKSY
jgi:hypothetical protein